MKKIIYTILLMISFTIVQAKNIEEEIIGNVIIRSTSASSFTYDNTAGLSLSFSC